MREPVSGLTHLAAAIAALAGLVLLLHRGSDSGAEWLALAIYGLSLVLMFAASAAYHLVDRGPETTRLLRRLDHAAIYLLIAGTYAPVCLHFFSGFWRWGLLAIVWGMALVVMAAKLFSPPPPRWLTAGIYLLMGWLSLLAVEQMLATMPGEALAWLVAGGVAFTLGAVVYVSRRPDFYPGVFGFHEVWHLFVIAGSFCHFVVVAEYVAGG